MKYCLVRILGNDQPPRHAINQTEKNIQFILKNEPQFPNCDKIFVLNRMWHPKKQARIKKLITAAGYKTLLIPFRRSIYIKLKSDKARLLYLTNQNEARNFTVTELRDKYDIILPFDSGTCFRQDGWDAFIKGVESRELQPYYVVPMWRLQSHPEYFNGTPCTKEKYLYKYGKRRKHVMGSTEPQICLTKNSDRLFTEGMEYGNANKVDMLWMLGVNGPWWAWSPILQARANKRMSIYKGKIRSYGFVCRLPSGSKQGDSNSGMRGHLRNKAKAKILEDVANFLKIPIRRNKHTLTPIKPTKVF